MAIVDYAVKTCCFYKQFGSCLGCLKTDSWTGHGQDLARPNAFGLVRSIPVEMVVNRKAIGPIQT